MFAKTSVCRAGRPATRYRDAREPLPRVPTAFQGSKCVRGGLKRRKYQVKARYQVRANALLASTRSLPGKIRQPTNRSGVGRVRKAAARPGGLTPLAAAPPPTHSIYHRRHVACHLRQIGFLRVPSSYLSLFKCICIDMYIYNSICHRRHVACHLRQIGFPRVPSSSLYHSLYMCICMYVYI